jgi:hypothetical protein
MRFKLGELLFLSRFEKGRKPQTNADPRSISAFEDLNQVIAQSLMPEVQIPVTAEATKLAVSAQQNPFARPFADQNLLEKLIQYRSQIPVSHRIIRAPRNS